MLFFSERTCTLVDEYKQQFLQSPVSYKALVLSTVVLWTVCLSGMQPSRLARDWFIKQDLTKTHCEDVNWTEMIQDKAQLLVP
jgi:hypothetical protein